MPVFGVGNVYRFWTPKGGPPQYMMRSDKNPNIAQVPLFPDTLTAFIGPQVTHEYTSFEGLVTWTLVRVRGRLRRATETGNIGAAMRYQQMQRWLESCLHHLPTASLQDREKTLNSLSDENMNFQKMTSHRHTIWEEMNAISFQTAMGRPQVHLETFGASAS